MVTYESVKAKVKTVGRTISHHGISRTDPHYREKFMAFIRQYRFPRAMLFRAVENTFGTRSDEFTSEGKHKSRFGR